MQEPYVAHIYYWNYKYCLNRMRVVGFINRQQQQQQQKCIRIFFFSILKLLKYSSVVFSFSSRFSRGFAVRMWVLLNLSLSLHNLCCDEVDMNGTRKQQQQKRFLNISKPANDNRYKSDVMSPNTPSHSPKLTYSTWASRRTARAHVHTTTRTNAWSFMPN